MAGLVQNMVGLVESTEETTAVASTFRKLAAADKVMTHQARVS